MLALVVAFMVIFESNLTVLAGSPNYYCIDSWGNWDSAAPTTLEPGDEIYFKYSGGILEVYMDGRLKETNTPDIPGSGPNHIVQESCMFSRGELRVGTYMLYLITPPAPSGGNTQPAPSPQPGSKPETKPEVTEEPKDTAPPAEVREHAFSWVESVAPTANSDGLSEYKCSCGLVESSQPISCGVAFTQEFNDLIRNAPENGIVENQPEMFRCYTKKMMEELAKRPDVSLKTTYVDEEGNLRSFTIPAGQAPVEDDLFYGFVYLGNRYGWQ